MLRGLRHRNLAAIKMATQRGIHQLQGPGDKQYQYQEKVSRVLIVILQYYLVIAIDFISKLNT